MQSIVETSSNEARHEAEILRQTSVETHRRLSTGQFQQGQSTLVRSANENVQKIARKKLVREAVFDGNSSGSGRTSPGKGLAGRPQTDYTLNSPIGCPANWVHLRLFCEEKYLRVN